jgi:hypothetical protein
MPALARCVMALLHFSILMGLPTAVAAADPPDDAFCPDIEKRGRKVLSKSDLDQQELERIYYSILLWGEHCDQKPLLVLCAKKGSKLCADTLEELNRRTE